MNKEVKINFRVSEYEKKRLQSKARKAEMKLSEFCRRSIFDKKIVIADGLAECSCELNKIGNNINQIAVAANQGRDVAPTMAAIKARMSETFDNIDRILGGAADSDRQTD